MQERLTREELIKLVAELSNFKGTEEELNNKIEMLHKNVLDPEVTNYIYWDDLTPEEIVDKALSYKPILL